MLFPTIALLTLIIKIDRQILPILTCAQKLARASLIYRTEPRTKNRNKNERKLKLKTNSKCHLFPANCDALFTDAIKLFKIMVKSFEFKSRSRLSGNCLQQPFSQCCPLLIKSTSSHSGVVLFAQNSDGRLLRNSSSGEYISFFIILFFILYSVKT